MQEKTYRFKFTIETEDEEVLEGGNTFVVPSSISEYGECESVDHEVGKYLRIFKKRIENKSDFQKGMDEAEDGYTEVKDSKNI